MKNLYPLHVRISEKGFLEQLETMFPEKRKYKKVTKETKGQWKHNIRRKGIHPRPRMRGIY
jgi:hypothetical protein